MAVLLLAVLLWSEARRIPARTVGSLVSTACDSGAAGALRCTMRSRAHSGRDRTAEASAQWRPWRADRSRRREQLDAWGTSEPGTLRPSGSIRQEENPIPPADPRR